MPVAARRLLIYVKQAPQAALRPRASSFPIQAERAEALPSTVPMSELPSGP